MSQAKVIDKLNEILRHEWTGVAQYAQAGFLVSGMWREVYSDMFFDSAKESFKHAQTIGDKIVALGGVPSVERNPVQQSGDLEEMLKVGLEFETKAVQLYNEALALAEGDRALVVLLEDILLEEQEGVDHITKLLKQHDAGAGAGDASRSRTKTG
jgi:bacterioferritin